MVEFVTLTSFIQHLRAAVIITFPEGEDWKAMIERLCTPGRIAEIEEETFYYFLEVLPPKYQSGRMFAFAEGAEALRLFWRSDDKHFCRQLTDDETKTFCRLARIPIPW